MMARLAPVGNGGQRRTGDRRELVTDAAISVLAKSGARGLTHRSVDSEAGLPEGSTSNLFRTRDALLAAVLERHVERELEVLTAIERASAGPATGPREVAALLASFVAGTTTGDAAELTAARYELYLEVRRRPELSDQLAVARAGYAELISALLTDSGVSDSPDDADAVLALVEGLSTDLMFHSSSAMSDAARSERILLFLESLQ